MECGYEPGSRATWEDPGSGPEIGCDPIVTYSKPEWGYHEVITYDSFMVLYAIDVGLPLEKAEDKLVEIMTVAATEKFLSERYDD